jgi:GntR family transcriptional regulator
MIVEVDPDAATPPYEQIRSQLATMIEAGTLPVDMQLPTIRQLAGDLAVAPGTVARAYTELERAGLVVSRRRGGTVVSSRAAQTEAVRAEQLEMAARAYALASRQLGVGTTDAVRALRDQLGTLGTA